VIIVAESEVVDMGYGPENRLADASGLRGSPFPMVSFASEGKRKRKATDQEKLARMVQLYFVERLSMRKVAEVLGVSHMSVYRVLSDPNVELLI